MIGLGCKGEERLDVSSLELGSLRTQEAEFNGERGTENGEQSPYLRTRNQEQFANLLIFSFPNSHILSFFH